MDINLAHTSSPDEKISTFDGAVMEILKILILTLFMGHPVDTRFYKFNITSFDHQNSPVCCEEYSRQ